MMTKLLSSGLWLAPALLPAASLPAQETAGEIIALLFANGKFLGKTNERVYELYARSDGGRTFEKRSVLPFDTVDRRNDT